MSELAPTPEEAKAHKFLKAGRFTGWTLERAAADPAGRAYLKWWLETQPAATSTYRHIQAYVAAFPLPAPAPAPAAPAPTTGDKPS